MDRVISSGDPPDDAVKDLRKAIKEDISRIYTLTDKDTMKAADKTEVKNVAKAVLAKVDLIIRYNTSLRSISELVDQKLSGLNDLLTKNGSSVSSSPTMSYAKAASSKPAILNTDNKLEESTIVIKAKSSTQVKESQNCVYDEVMDIRKKKKNVKINKIIRTRTGAIVKLPKSEDIDSLIKEFIKSDKLKNVSEVYKGKALSPTVVLKGVNKQTDYTKLPAILCQMNPSLAGKEAKIKVIRVLGYSGNSDSKESNDVALRIESDVYQDFKKMKTVFTDIECVRWRDKIFVRQCQNCLRFNPNHIRKDCNKERHCFCGQIGAHNCDHSLKCINCATHPKHKDGDHKHRPNTTDCPLYKQQQDIIFQRTCFSDGTSHVGLDDDLLQ